MPWSELLLLINTRHRMLEICQRGGSTFAGKQCESTSSMCRAKNQSSTRRQRLKLCLLGIWEPQYLRKKKKKWADFDEISGFSWNGSPDRLINAVWPWEICLPILLFRKIIFNSQLTVSIPRKPVSWRMRKYCTEDPFLFFFNSLKEMSNVKGW